MAKAQNKTQPTTVSPDDYIAGIDHPVRREDAAVLLDLMRRITGWDARMWGPSIVGFGQYHYTYESGREGDFMRTGFSARKANLVVYILPGYTDFSEILTRLGKHKLGKSCLYINKLTDVDLAVLEELIRAGLADMAEKYPEGA
ncbi:DUF1801 domain-containing protein [Maricaulis alexandrii]|uniref:DUF1801 domain-containing protein n=1 Tax=Maricaulis alexandrii TaxID=2570354 RepID=UPI0011089193|nr:DUF1801 domain-containing protein [Maricaulis alexandrii]